MAQGFKIDGYFIPISFDNNKDKKLQVSELNIWCKANDMKYENGKIKTALPYDAETVPEKFDAKKYSIENIKKRYPADKYNIEQNKNVVTVYDKNANLVLCLIKHTNGQLSTFFYDSKNNELYCKYDSFGKLIKSTSYIDNQKKVHSPLTDKLHADVSAKTTLGLPTTGKNIESHINALNVDNIASVLIEYQEKYKRSLISDIFSERGLDAEKRAQYAKHIVDELCQLCTVVNSKGAAEQIKAGLYKTINEEKDKIGMMDSANIDKLVNILLEESCGSREALLAHQLRKDVSAKNAAGLPTTSNTLGKNVKSINSENVVNVMKEYESQNNEQSLLSDIIEERGLKTNTRKIYIKHIVNSYLTYAENKGINVNDLKQKFNNEITYQMDKFGFANADYLNVFIRQLRARISASDSEDFLTKPNGKIDEEFFQNATGDCWLLASIKAISNSPKGLEILNNSIKVNKDGSVNVTLRGVNKTYTISKKELESNIQLSKGDGDVRALEIAVNKYFEEERGVNDKLDIHGNQMYTAYKILIGDKNIDDGKNNIIQFYVNGLERYKEIDDELIESFNDPNKITTVAANGNKQDIKVMDAKKEQVLTTGHAYAIIRADSNYVYLVNPWKSNSEIKITRELFKSFFNEYNQMEL